MDSSDRERAKIWRGLYETNVALLKDIAAGRTRHRYLPSEVTALEQETAQFEAMLDAYQTERDARGS